MKHSLASITISPVTVTFQCLGYADDHVDEWDFYQSYNPLLGLQIEKNTIRHMAITQLDQPRELLAGGFF